MMRIIIRFLIYPLLRINYGYGWRRNHNAVGYRQYWRRWGRQTGFVRLTDEFGRLVPLVSKRFLSVVASRRGNAMPDRFSAFSVHLHSNNFAPLFCSCASAPAILFTCRRVRTRFNFVQSLVSYNQTFRSFRQQRTSATPGESGRI